MRLKSTTSDLSSSHDVKVHLHNVTDRDRDRCGLWKEHGKKSRSGLEHVRRASEQEGSRKDLASTRVLRPCAHSVLFWKADWTEKETGGTEVDIQTGDTGGNI